MAAEFWAGDNFRETHEREARERLVRAFTSRFKDSSEPIFLAFNVFCHGKEFDLLVLKRDAVIVVDLKNCDKPIIATENGPWRIRDGGLLRGGAAENPFRQIADYRYALMAFLEEKKEKFLRPQKAAQADFGHIRGIVAISPSLHPESDRSAIDTKHVWFRLIGEDGLAELTATLSSKRFSFGREELRILIEEVLKCPRLEPAGTTKAITARTEIDAQPRSLWDNLDLAGRTYYRYRDIEVPLIESPELITGLAARYGCTPLRVGAQIFPGAIVWKNDDRLIAPDSILGEFDDTPPRELKESAMLSPSEYLAARGFIKAEFEKGPIKREGRDYRMTSIKIDGDLPKITGAYGLYYDNVLTQYAMEWELKKALLESGDDVIDVLTKPGVLPLREAAEEGHNPILDGTGRCAVLGVSTLLVFRRRQPDGFFCLLRRRSGQVGVSPGMLHVVPSGVFEAPNREDPWSVEMNVWRELLEEVYNDEEQQGRNEEVFEDYLRSKPPKDSVIDMIERGTAKHSVTGIYCDLFHLRPEICTVLFIEDYKFAEEREVELNWEYARADWNNAVGKVMVPWNEIDDVIENVTPGHGFCPGGAAAFSLGRDWLKRNQGI